jgi:hypothetical protein
MKNGDLAAGWQAIIATRKSRVNHALKGLFDDGVIPETVHLPFTVGRSEYVLDACITSAPEIIDGDTRAVKLKIDLKARISPAVLMVERVHGYVVVTVNLEDIEVWVERETAEDFLLSFDLARSELFDADAIDFSHLKPVPPPPNFQKGITDALNDAARAIPFPLQFHIRKPLPSSLNGLALRVAYTKVPGDAEKDFLSVLFGLVDDLGRRDLSPSTISDRAGADTAFVFSNRLIMQTIRTRISNVASRNGLEFGFELSDDDPARISNTKEVRFDAVPLVCLKIKRRSIRIFIHDERLHVNVSFRYTNVATFGLWHAMDVTSATSFTSENGNIRATVACHLDVPWTVFLNMLAPCMLPLFVFLEACIPGLVDGERDSLIVVPEFDVSSIFTPAYVQISGNVNPHKGALSRIWERWNAPAGRPFSAVAKTCGKRTARSRRAARCGLLPVCW